MRNLIVPALVLGTVVATTGCATRGWVRQIEGQVQQQGRQIESASKRVDGLDERVGAFGQRLDDADSRIGRLARHHHAGSVVETAHIHFRFDGATLDDAAMTRLNELAKEIRRDGRLAVELVGHTDGRGAREYNVQLAQRRVAAVARYLVERGVPVSRVAAIGLGPLAERNVPDAQKRRVTLQVTMSEAMVMAESTGLPQQETQVSPAPQAPPQSH